MVKLMCIGDLHYKTDNIDESIHLNDLLCQMAEQWKPDRIIIMGDTLHTHRKIDMDPLCLAHNFFHRLSKISPVRVLIGNHDRRNNSDFLSHIHPFVSISDTHELKIISQVYTEMIMENTIELCYIPYVPPGKFKDAIATKISKISPHQIFLAHQEIRGVKMGSQISEHGDIWPSDYPLLISGHIHQYQKINNNVIYVGTPRTTDFGDSTDKTISIFTIEEPLPEYISKSMIYSYKENRVSVPLPKHLTIEIGFNQIEEIELPTDVPRLRICIRGTPEEIKSLGTHLIVNRWKKNGIKIVTKTSHPAITSTYCPSDTIEKIKLPFLDEMKAFLIEKELPDELKILDDLIKEAPSLI